VEVELLIGDGPVSAITYIAKSDRVDDLLKPYTWYKEFVARGARQHGLPEVHVQMIEAFEAINDPDEGRKQKIHALLFP
jgi:hypothetical protein